MSKNVSSTCALRHAALAQQLVVDPVELALADRAGRLQLADRASDAEASPITRMPRAIAPLVTTITSSPSRVQVARAGRRRARSTSMRSSPSLSATTLEPSLITTRLIDASAA